MTFISHGGRGIGAYQAFTTLLIVMSLYFFFLETGVLNWHLSLSYVLRMFLIFPPFSSSMFL